MKKTVDARGLSCPQPVILAGRAIDEGEFPIVVLVDTGAACENVQRMGESRGFKVATKEVDGGEFEIVISS